jgi:hypothetical protein
MTVTTYEQAVMRLSQKVFDEMNAEGFENAVERGLRGIRQLPNEVLREEWEVQFDEELVISDPESNPNGEWEAGLSTPHP